MFVILIRGGNREGHCIVVTRYETNESGKDQFYIVDPYRVLTEGAKEIKLERADAYPTNFFSNIEVAMTINSVEKPHICGADGYETYRDANGKIIALGACKNKGCHQPYDYNVKQYTDHTGIWKRKLSYTGKIITLKEKPYADASSFGKADAAIPILYFVKNAYNSTWYATYVKTPSGDYKTAYFYLDDKITKYLSKVENASLAVPDIKEDVVIPKSTSNGGTQKTATTNTNKTNSVVSKNISVNWTKFPEQINVGDSYGLRGKISSNYPIYYVSAMLLDESGNSVIPSIDFSAGGVKTINITANQVINAKMYFNRIKTGGNYRVRIIVNCNSNGSQDGIWYQDYPFTVKGNELTAPEPTITTQTIEEGQRAIMNSGTNTTIHYKVNGGSEQTCSNGQTLDFKIEGSYNIEAWTTGVGYVSSPHIYKTIAVSKVKTPIIGDVVYGENETTIALVGNGTINYTTDGSTPTKDSSEYVGIIPLYGNTTIKAIARQHGKKNSDIASKTLTISKPDVPSGLTLYNTKSKIAQGKIATIEWNSSERAAGYIAKLYYNGEYTGKKYETRGTKASFTLPNVGTYTIKISATNSIGTSAESPEITVESMAPVTVKFVDRILREGKVTDDVVNQIQQNVNAHYGEEAKEIEGNVISVQKIDYDTKPNVPTWDDKEGFSRQYFEGIDKNITEDTTIYAYYKVKDYNVQFWNYWTYDSENNAQIGETQNILYSYSAKAPTEMNAPTGYTLAGWNVDAKSECYDFTFVNGDMKLYTSYTWENKDLPVIMEFVSAKRGNTCQSYDITLKYINNNLTDTQARIIMSLYTADGRMVYTATEDVDLMARDPGIYYTETIQATYPNKISKISAVMVQVKDDKTGGAVSKMISTTDIEMPNDGTTWTAWSSWSTTQPSSEPARYSDVKGNKREIESKTQYRARSKQYTTSSSNSLSGWTHYNTQRTSWGATVGPVYYTPNGNGRNVWSENYVTSSNYKTIYHYYRYAKAWSGGYGAATAQYPNYYAYDFDYELPRYTGNYGYKWYWGSGSGDWNTVWRADYIGKPYTTQQWVSDNYGTRWYYQEPVYTYYFWKWNNWSAWGDKSVSGDETQKRTVYRWRDNFNNYPGYDPDRDSTLEEKTINTYEISGNINGLTKDYNGKLATVLVYKKTNTDPTQEQLEYVDQITIGENNSYSFIVNPKEEISYEDTGDYIVTLSLEGSENLANVDVIKAPVPQCKVTFQNDDGSILKDENGNDLIKYVDKNGSLDVNEITIPTKGGYRFVKWDRSLINIDKDMTVSPLYEKEVYNVVYVDYENKTADMVEVSYGNPINLPEVEEVEGKEFIGWDAECYKYATEGNIDTDIFNIKEEAPYYLTTDGTYILVSDYNSEEHNIVDRTEYYKYFSEKNTIITESKIITALWKPSEYVVEFCDFDGNVVSKQIVAYGKTATPPKRVEKDGVLYSWDLTGEEWWNVTKDMAVYPCVPHTIDSPTVSEPTDNGCGTFTTELETTVESGKIYYSVDFEITEKEAKSFVDGKSVSEENEEQIENISLMSDITDEETATENGTTSDEVYLTVDNMIQEYTEPIELYAGSVVYAFTVDTEGNISPVSVFQYDSEYSDEDLGLAPNEYVPDPDTPQITMPTICAKPGETVTIPISIKNNMGINYLEIVMGYDTDSLTLESTENGNVFENDGFTSYVREDGSCKFVWECENDNFNDGTLMNLTFKVKDSAEKAKYMFDLRVEYSGDENDEEWYFVTVPGALTGEETLNGTLGDINEDGDVDFSDAIVILKYDAGLKDIDDSKLPLGDVDFSDAILIIKFDAGLISEFKKNN